MKNAHEESGSPTAIESEQKPGATIYQWPIAGFRWYWTCFIGDGRINRPRPVRGHARDRTNRPNPEGRSAEQATSAARHPITRLLMSIPAFPGARQVIGVVLLTLIGLATAAVPYRHTLTTRLSAITRPDFAAPPYFSLGAFHELRCGMTESEVRDRVGYPIGRRDYGSGAAHWVYTRPVGSDTNRFKLCVAVFNEETHRLIRIREDWSDTFVGFLSFNQTLTSHAVGDLQLVRPDGSTLQLSSIGAPCLIARGDGPAADLLNPAAEPSGPPLQPLSDTMRVFELRKTGDTGKSSYRSYGDFTDCRPSLPKELKEAIFVYRDGFVFEVPPLRQHDPGTLADRSWLFEKLAAEHL